MLETEGDVSHCPVDSVRQKALISKYLANKAARGKFDEACRCLTKNVSCCWTMPELEYIFFLSACTSPSVSIVLITSAQILQHKLLVHTKCEGDSSIYHGRRRPCTRPTLPYINATAD